MTWGYSKGSEPVNYNVVKKISSVKFSKSQFRNLQWDMEVITIPLDFGWNVLEPLRLAIVFASSASLNW